MILFYATGEDLIPVFETVESKLSLKYTSCSHLESPELDYFYSGADLPTLNEPLSNGSAINSPTYLISRRETEIKPREITIHRKAFFSIDQLDNADTAVFSHGGFYGESVLLHGRVATASKSETSLKLQRTFASSIKKHFSKIQAFYVGCRAEKLLDNGYRLTFADQSPQNYDLKRII